MHHGVMGARRHWQGEGGTCPPGNVYKCISSYNQTLSTAIIYAFIFYNSRFLWRVGVVIYLVLACVLRATTKKRSSTFSRKKVHLPRENPGYACEFARPWKKFCGRSCLRLKVDRSAWLVAVKVATPDDAYYYVHLPCIKYSSVCDKCILYDRTAGRR